MRSLLYSGLGLALALALALALVLILGTVLPQPSGVTAAPLPQRTRQPTSNTATPRITLPTDTPTTGAPPTATGRGPTAVPTGGAAVTDSPLATPPAGGSPAPGGTGQSGGTGSSSGRLPTDPGAVVTPGSAEGGTGPPGIGPPALPGSEGAAGGEGVRPGGATDGGEGAAGGGGLLTLPGSGEAGDAALDGVPEDVGPSGFLRVPVPDPRLRALWAASGSPREGQGLAERFTEGRPGPWGFSLFYVLLVGLFGVVVFRLWGALGGLDARDSDGEAVDEPLLGSRESETSGRTTSEQVDSPGRDP